MTLSFNERRNLVEAALSKEGKKSFWIKDMYEDSAIYSDYENGGMFQITYTIDAKNEITFGKPQQVIEKKSYEPVVITTAFDLEGEANFSDDYVIRKGKIFEVGEYPDKNFSLTEEELRNAVSLFKPVPLDLEHQSTVLDGHLGYLNTVEISEDGKTLFGVVALPKWLDALIEDGKRKVSTTWNRLTKEIVGLALVNAPRISDATLMSAFSDFAGKRHSLKDQEEVQSMHDTSLRLGASCPAPKQTSIFISEDENPEGEETTMPKTEESAVPPAETSNPDVEAALAQMRVDMEKLQKENSKLLSNQRRREAEKFADDQVTAFKAFISERNTIASLYEQALIDDEEDNTPVGLAKFGETKSQATRVAALKAMFVIRPSHESLVKEDIDTELDEEGTLVFTKKAQEDPENPAPMDELRRKKLLGTTPLGSQVLNG